MLPAKVYRFRGRLLIAEVEAAKQHVESITTVISSLPPGLVKRRMEQALRDVDAEIQAQLWGHLKAKWKPSPGERQHQPQQGGPGGARRGMMIGQEVPPGNVPAGVVPAGRAGAGPSGGPSPTVQVLMKVCGGAMIS